MPTVTLYVPIEQQALWQQAEAAAAKAGESLSGFAAEAIRARLTRSAGRPEESTVALARRLVEQLERERGQKKTANRRGGTRRKA